MLNRRKMKVKPTDKLRIGEQNGICTKFDIDLDSSAVVSFGSDEYKLTAKNLKSLKNLGSGNYGSVDLRIHELSGTIMAVKTMQISEEDKKNLKREIDVLKSSHSCHNVVRFYGAFFHEGTAFICMEAMDICLAKFYKIVFDKMQLGIMPEKFLGAITVSVLKALLFLKKELNVIHRDVKPSNILTNINGEIKMCDFGICGCLVDSRARSYVGCIRYMAPELFDTEQRTTAGYDVRSDVWSLGITLLEISSGRVPFQEFEVPYMFMEYLANNSPPSPPSLYSRTFVDFVAVCLQKDFQDRPYFNQLLDLEYPTEHANSITDDQYKLFVAEVIKVFSNP